MPPISRRRLYLLKGKTMQRLNGHWFYDLALKIHPLIDIQDEASFNESFFYLWEARDAILSIQAKIPLRACVPPANKVINAIDSLIPRQWADAFKLVTSKDKLGFTLYRIREGARELETVLEAELQGLDTYLVSQKGTHSTPDLIERAEIMFSEYVRNELSAETVNDIRQAGRCLALDNPTACAFHILRGLESVMAVYFERVTGKPLPTRMRNWSIYLKALRKHADHSRRIVDFLDHIRENYRNPILHPDVFVTEDEAEALLGVSASAIRMLVIETRALAMKPKSLSALSMVGTIGSLPPIAS